MKKELLKNIFVVLLCFSFVGVLAQQKTPKQKSTKQINTYNYSQIIEKYARKANKEKVTPELLQKVAEAYFLTNDYINAGKLYKTLFARFKDSVTDAEVYYRYAQTLQRAKNYEEAAVFFNGFANKNTESPRAKLILSEKNYNQEILNNSDRFEELVNIPINSPFSDFGAFLAKKKLLYVTAKDSGSLSKHVDLWTGGAFTKLYAASLNENDSLVNPTLFAEELSASKINFSSAIITKDGRTIYFTRNHQNPETSSKEIKYLNIYSAHLKDGKWTDIKRLSFNMDGYNTAFPSLSKDEKIMYFSSDRPGGYGASDIWSVAIENGTFMKPENLGSRINTDGRESFPFISDNDELYFSSDGRPGIGGLDVYASKRKKEGGFGPVQNVGEPINSVYDDFAFSINNENQRGYFSSNRPEGKGSDDIYSFKELYSLILECNHQYRVKIVNKEGKVILGAHINLISEDYATMKITNQSDNDLKTVGNDLDCGVPYKVRVLASGYQSKDISITFSNKEANYTEQVITLEPLSSKSNDSTDAVQPKVVPVIKKEEVKKLNEYGKTILFNSNKATLANSSFEALDNIVEVMQEYPTAKFIIEGHTDDSGNNELNLQLSQDRAAAVKEYLISKGINPMNLSSKGFGSLKPIDTNDTEQGKANNRRTEIKLID